MDTLVVASSLPSTTLLPPFLDTLLDLKHDGTPLLQIVLSGHPASGVTLQQPRLNDITRRIAVQYQLTALPNQLVGPFIRHRLTIAGGERQDIFPPDVVERISFYSEGIPRLINVICDNALLTACTLSQEAVSVENIEEVAQDLSLPPASEVKTQVTATDYTQEVTQPMGLASSAGLSAFGGSARLPAIPQGRPEASAEAPVETGLMFLQETDPDLASGPTEEAPPSFRFAPPHQEHPESASGESDTLASASPEQPEQPHQSEQSANKVSPSDIPEQPETNTWAAAAIPVDEIDQTVSDEVEDEVQDNWEDNREDNHGDNREDNWKNEGSQEEPVEFIIAPQHEPAQSSRSSWLARVGVGGVLLLVFGGVGYAMSSQSSPDWLSTLQSKAASLLNTASLSTLTQVWSSNQSRNEQQETVAGRDVPSERVRTPDESPALSPQERRLALVEQDHLARHLDPIQNPIQNLIQNKMDETPIAAPVSLEVAPKEQPPVENTAVETSLPHATEQQAAQSTEASPAREEQQPPAQEALGQDEETSENIPEPVLQLAALPAERSAHTGDAESLREATVSPDQSRREEEYLRKRQAARRQLYRLGIPFRSSSFVKNAERGNSEVVDLFLAAGMHSRITDYRHMTPLLVAAWNGHSTVVETLLSHSAALNQPNDQGLTPLMAAAWNGHVQVVRALLNSGADAHATDDSGYSAWTYAEEDRNGAVLALLRQPQAQKQ